MASKICELTTIYLRSLLSSGCVDSVPDRPSRGEKGSALPNLGEKGSLRPNLGLSGALGRRSKMGSGVVSR